MSLEVGKQFHICFLNCQLDWIKRGLGPLCVCGGIVSNDWQIAHETGWSWWGKRAGAGCVSEWASACLTGSLAAASICCHPAPVSLAIPCGLTTSDSSGSIHATSARLGLGRHGAAWVEQLLGSLPLQHVDSCSWSTWSHHVSQSH